MSAGGEGRKRDGGPAPRAGARPAGIPQPRALESPRLGGAGGRDPRRLGDHPDQRRRARAAERADHPLLRDQRPGESPRRAGHGRDLLLSSFPAAAVDQAPADGGSDSGGDHQGHAGPDGRRAGATSGAGAGRFAAGSGPAAPQEHRRSPAREIGTGADRVDRARRHALIPNRVTAVRGAMDFEKSTLEAVIQARNQAVKVNATGPEGIKQISRAENTLSSALQRLMVVVEQYPQLRATGNIGQLQEELTSTENKVAFARQLYNDTATLYNTKQQQFPTSPVAGLAKAQPADLWAVEDQREQDVPQVDLHLHPNT